MPGLTKQREGTVHLLIAQSIEQGQIAKKWDNPVNHESIIQQTQAALQMDIDIGADGFRRMAASFESLGKRREALSNYRRALTLDLDRQLKLHRKVIELLVDDENPTGADRELTDYLAEKDLTDAERSWALGLQGQLAIDASKYAEARVLLDQAAKLAAGTDRTHQGEVAYRNGYAAYKLEQFDEAERQFRVAREQMGIGNPLDADAAYLLARVLLTKNDTAQAEAFLRDVIVSHPEHKNAVLARLERGIIRINAGNDDAGLEDLKNVTNAVLNRPKLDTLKDDALAGMLRAEKALSDKNDQKGAIEILENELALAPEPKPAFFNRLANVLEKRADQLATASAAAPNATDRLKLQQESSALLTRAGKAYLKYSEKLTLTSDEGYAENLWKGIDCFDRAGDTVGSIGALELFIAERPEDPQTPDALLKVGRAYDAIGKIDKAITSYQKNLARYPNSLAASKSAVPLAQALMRQGSDYYAKAEKVLLDVVNNNPKLTPDSNEFRLAVFELGRLYYMTGSYEKAIGRLEEYAQRYPDDAKQVQLEYQMADSYWKSAGQIADQLAAIDSGTFKPIDGQKIPDRIDLIMERRERLDHAQAAYASLIALYRDKEPTGDLDKLYVKLSHFYQADCQYELGKYKESIDLFDRAAMLYPDDPSAVSAYMKIFAAYVELGQTDLASRAHARASVMLSRMPREAFSNGAYVISRDDREKFLRFASDSGLLR
ncbi:MAG: tetratricopeptide repeat protein [Tepidisphaeraceae bacterium]